MFERIQKMELSMIKQIEMQAKKYENVISLAQGIPNFDTPENIKEEVKKALDAGLVSKYSLSPGLIELRELISESLVKKGMDYNKDEIIVTVGAIEAITATILAITNPGDEVIIPDPTYPSYQHVIRLAGCEPVFTKLDNSWNLDLDDLEKKITKKTKAILFCNPNNPTGTIYSKEKILKLAELAKKYNLFIVTDEVYTDFIFENENEFLSPASLPDIRNQVIRILSFSKTYAMTGWRVGYLHSDKSIIKQILKVHDCLVTCAPVISQYAAIYAMQKADQSPKDFKQEYIKRLNLVCERLDKLSHVFSYIKPSSTYYMYLKINPKYLDLNNENPTLQFVLDLLEKTKVAMVPGSAFGPSGQGYVRISFGREENDINEAFNRIEKYFSKLIANHVAYKK